MDEQAIQTSIAVKLKDAVNFSNSNVATKHETALKYYKRAYLPGDDKIKGRSKWVSPEVQQRVDWSVASMIRIFDSPENVCEFLPFGPEDEAIARQQTSVVNWILKTKNSHLSFLQPWLQNGFICGLGIISAEFTTETIEGLPRTFKGIPDAQLLAFDQQEEAGQIVIEEASKPYLNEAGMSVRDLKIRAVRRNPVFNILSVAPEDFIISRDAKIDPETGGIAAKLQGHRKIVSKAALLELGYDAEKVSQIALASSKSDGIALERSKDLDGDQGVSGDDVEVFVVYSKMKLDKKKARHYRFTLAGGIEKPVLLDYEETTRFYPYAPFVPFPQADTLFSMGIPDKIGDDHVLLTRIQRAVIDDLHSHVNPTKVVNPDSTNLDDLLNQHPGSIVRSSDPTGGISYSIPPFAGGDAMPVIANLSNSLDFTTGVGPQMVSLNASDLQNATATAVNQRNNSSQLLVEMISRYFADTGYAYLIRIVIDQLIQKPEEAQAFIARLTNNFVPIDEFSPEMDVTTSVAFGVMSRDQSAAALNNLLMQQMQAMQSGLPIVNAQTMYNTLAKLSETAGFKNSSLFFVDPSTLPPAPPPPTYDPNAGLIEMEKVKAQLKAQSDEADRNFEMQKLVAQLQQQQSEFNSQMELKTKQLEQDYLLKLMELDKKYSQQNTPGNDLSQMMIEVPHEQY